MAGNAGHGRNPWLAGVATARHAERRWYSHPASPASHGVGMTAIALCRTRRPIIVPLPQHTACPGRARLQHGAYAAKNRERILQRNVNHDSESKRRSNIKRNFNNTITRVGNIVIVTGVTLTFGMA